MCVSLLALPALAVAEAGEEPAEESETVGGEAPAEPETEPPLEEVPPAPEPSEAPAETEDPANTQEPVETGAPVETEAPAQTEEPAASEEPELLDGAGESRTVSYYVGQTLLRQETVAAGGYPAKVPAVDGEGRAITGWLNEAGSIVTVSKIKIEEDTSYYAWYAPQLVSEHIRFINGTGNAMFSPNKQLTRAEAATILYNLLQSKELGPYECTFSDVSSSAWYYTAVRTLASYKVLAGYADGTFRPNQGITRAEFVTILVRLVGVQDADVTFSDVASTHWAADYIATAANKGWVSGYGDGRFKPSATITRAEAVKVVDCMLGRSADAGTLAGGEGILRYLDVPESQWYYPYVMEASIGHTHTSVSGGEVWTDYTVESCGLPAGIHNINGALYYVRRDTNQIAAVTKGVNELDGGLYLAAYDGFAICADFASKPGYVVYDDGSQTALGDGFNLIDGWTYIYWDGDKSAMRKLTADAVNLLDGYYYLANSDGYTICTDMGYESGVVEANGKLYISNGSYTIVATYLDYTASASSPKTRDLKNSTYEYNGNMYYVQADYSLLTDAWQGYLYFDKNGRYTTGDSSLDAYVYSAIKSIINNNALTQQQKLLKAYYYLRGGEGKTPGSNGFGYRQTGEGYTRTRYNGQYQYAWAIKCAKRMFSQKSGMCYEWATAYLYMARRLGFQAYVVVGNVFQDRYSWEDARHCWCMIKWNGVWHISDVEIEWGYLNKWYTGTSTYWNLFDQAVSTEWLTFYMNPECNSIKYYFKDES